MGVALLATPASPSFTLIFRVFLQDAPESNRVYRGLPPASPHKLFGSWLPAGGSSCRSVCGGSASFCLLAAGPSASPPIPAAVCGLCCSGKGWTAGQDPAWHLRMPSQVCRACRQMLAHQAAGRDPAAFGQGAGLAPDVRSPGQWGREGGEGHFMNAVVCFVWLSKVFDLLWTLPEAEHCPA